MKSLLVVGCGGFAGSSIRYLVYSLVKRYATSLFPWATVIVNLSGSFLMGVLFALVSKHLVPKNLQLFFMTGFLGSLTTFSTYSLDTLSLLELGKYKTAFINIGINNLGGIAAAFCGIALASFLSK